jgi:hypothetical protein
MSLPSHSFAKFNTETPVGAITNMGLFIGFDAEGIAHFVRDNGAKGWAGVDTFHFVQIWE